MQKYAQISLGKKSKAYPAYKFSSKRRAAKCPTYHSQYHNMNKCNDTWLMSEVNSIAKNIALMYRSIKNSFQISPANFATCSRSYPAQTQEQAQHFHQQILFHILGDFFTLNKNNNIVTSLFKQFKTARTQDIFYDHTLRYEDEYSFHSIRGRTLTHLCHLLSLVLLVNIISVS